MFHQPVNCVTLMRSYLLLKKKERHCTIKLNVSFFDIAYISRILCSKGTHQACNPLLLTFCSPFYPSCLYRTLQIFYKMFYIHQINVCLHQTGHVVSPQNSKGCFTVSHDRVQSVGYISTQPCIIIIIQNFKLLLKKLGK